MPYQFVQLANINISCQKAKFRKSISHVLLATSCLLSPDIKYVRLRHKTKFEILTLADFRHVRQTTCSSQTFNMSSWDTTSTSPFAPPATINTELVWKKGYTQVFALTSWASVSVREWERGFSQYISYLHSTCISAYTKYVSNK